MRPRTRSGQIILYEEREKKKNRFKLSQFVVIYAIV